MGVELFHQLSLLIGQYQVKFVTLGSLPAAFIRIKPFLWQRRVFKRKRRLDF